MVNLYVVVEDWDDTISSGDHATRHESLRER
jgi:hypothetical protein